MATDTEMSHVSHRAGVSGGMSGSVSRCMSVSVVIQVDDVIRARTAAMTMSGPSLALDHAFHLPLERAQSMKVLVLTQGKNQV